MVIWGAVWGAIVAVLISRYGGVNALFVGAVLGALAGWTLRKAVRKELAAAQSSALAGVLPASEHWEPEQDTAPAALATHAAPSPTTQARVLAPLPAREPLPPRESLPPHKPLPVPEADGLSLAFNAARHWLLGGNTIVRIGVLVLFVGLAFLAKYAMENALLPPEVRLAGIGAAGIALFVLGLRLRRRTDRLAYALTLQGAGVAVLYLTVFAAFRLYQFLPAGAAFAVLGLVCAFSTAIALLQNAMPMAFIGFAGAFAVPILVSTSQGNHVGLFSYYLLLGVAITVVAWLRAWRALNLLGFFATFGVATLWGALKYQPEFLSSTEPFLLAFFALYLAASVCYATRHGLQPKQAVDGTLVFGLPLVAFGLQAALVRQVEYATAFSALALGAVYLALGWWALRRKDEGVGQWLAQCFVAIGLGFVTLAVPLALDARWTSSVWAAEGAAVYWLGQRQGRWLARLAGLVLQALAALSYFSDMQQASALDWPLANPAFIGALLLAASALALAHWTRFAATASHNTSTEAKRFGETEQGLSPILFWAGFLYWQLGLWHEIERGALDYQGVWVPVLSSALQDHLEMLGWLVSAWAVHHLALPTREKPWAIAATPAWFSLPFMLLIAVVGMVNLDHVFQSWGWVVWPAALALHIFTLRRLDALPPQRWWSWVHSGGVWLLVLLGGNLLWWGVQQAQLQHTAWASVVLLASGVAVLLALSHRALYKTQSALRTHWPLDRFSSAYLWRAALPVALAVALGALIVAVNSNGNAQPLPYVPVLNPTDLTVALALLACSLWVLRLRQSGLPVPASLHSKNWTIALAVLAFVAVNTAWLRVAHQWAGVPWRSDSLFLSFLVQAGYSILWTVLALGLMVLAQRRHARPLWMAGAVLLGLTVAKLFLIDLSNREGSERIVAFIAVGLMMLVVGYFAPLPPAASAASPSTPNAPDGPDADADKPKESL